MATTTAINDSIMHELATALAYKFAPPTILIHDPQVERALALDSDRSHSIITAAHKRTVANVTARVWRELPAGSKEDFRITMRLRVVEHLKQVLVRAGSLDVASLGAWYREGGVEEIRLRACLVAELGRVGVVEKEVLEESISRVEMCGVNGLYQVYLGICEEMRRRSVGSWERGSQDKEGEQLSLSVNYSTLNEAPIIEFTGQCDALKQHT
ncbi:hypothetical protein DFP72DRAFT_854221 [Ephemerocybe angulata]|uniref:Uncharacterized protein n=1 Tax=Ephemerocybe angulata TaxID=980116 RepID=A0A8H6LZE3_9AGAR|nr:hypothetical protein DFP72DRAFT_854221 [Tulosesus angulatus]